MTQKQELAKKTESPPKADLQFSSDGLIINPTMEGLWRLSTCYSRSDLVPPAFRGKPDNCFIAVQMAVRCRVDPFMFLQNCYVVHGKPGIESKLAIAMLNSSGLIVGRIRYEQEGTGESTVMRAVVVDAETKETIAGPPVSWKMVKDEGWLAKDGSKWKTMPDIMFRYRSAMFLIRTTYPEILMGISTVEELEESDTRPSVELLAPTALDELTNRLLNPPLAKQESSLDLGAEASDQPEKEPDPPREDPQPKESPEPMATDLLDKWTALIKAKRTHATVEDCYQDALCEVEDKITDQSERRAVMKQLTDIKDQRRAALRPGPAEDLFDKSESAQQAGV